MNKISIWKYIYTICSLFLFIFAGFADAQVIFIEAEDYTMMHEVDTQSCVEGGLNVGWIDDGDWIIYNINIPAAGEYEVEYRVASPNGGGKIRLEQDAGKTVLGEVDVDTDGGWQEWTTIKHTVTLSAGYQEFGIGVPTGGFNLNWFKFIKKEAEFGKIEAEDFSNFYDTTGSVGTEICSDIDGGLNVGWVVPNEWLEYDIVVPNTGLYNIGLRVASKDEAGVLRILIDGVDATNTITFDATGDWQKWTTIPAGALSLTEGSHVVRILFESKDLNINYIEFADAEPHWAPFNDNKASIEIVEDKTAGVTLKFDSSGFRANDWGTVTGEGNNLSVDINVERWTGPHDDEQIELKNSYPLGELSDGRYTFTVNTNGKLIKKILFIVGQETTPEVPGHIEAEDYVTFYDTTVGNTGNVYRDDNVDIGECTDNGGGFHVGWITQGEWLDYDVNVRAAGKYIVKYRVTSDSGNGALQLVVNNGEVLATTRVVNTHGWQSWIDVYAVVTLNAGNQTIRLNASGYDFNINWIEFIDFSDYQRTLVTVNGRQIMVNGEPFQIKGVCWNPVPKGENEDQHGVNYGEYVQDDAEKMKSAGINVVRTYWPITDVAVLDVLYENGIYVINMMFMKNGVDYKINESVNKVKNHPTILMWGIGNEWNGDQDYQNFGSNIYWRMVYLNNLADQIKSLDTTHPIVTTYAVNIPEQWVIDEMHNIDVWGLQIYNWLGFSNSINDWRDKSAKPMFMSEYGADSWNKWDWKTDEESQALAARELTQQIFDNSSAVNSNNTCAGGTIFEWSDEWWKTAGGSDWEQDSGGYTGDNYGPYPDRTFNEEHWGIVNVDRIGKSAYEELKKLYNQQ